MMKSPIRTTPIGADDASLPTRVENLTPNSVSVVASLLGMAAALLDRSGDTVVADQLRQIRSELTARACSRADGE